MILIIIKNMSSRYAVIDIGSNTMKLNVYLAQDNRIDMLFHKKSITSLASYIDDGVMNEKGIDVIIAQIIDFNNTLKKLEIPNVFVIATAAIRGAQNNLEIIEKVKSATDIEIELIASDLEAVLGYKGLPEELRFAGGINVDVGGGSSEILIHEDNKIVFSKSMPVGCLSLYSEYVSMIFPNREEAEKIKKRVDLELERLMMEEDLKKKVNITAIGGTARAAIKLLNALYPQNASDRILKSQMDEVLDIILSEEHKEKSKVVKTLAVTIPERIHIICIGMLIYQRICERLNIHEMQVSMTGIMDGYLHYRLFE